MLKMQNKLDQSQNEIERLNIELGMDEKILDCRSLHSNGLFLIFTDKAKAMAAAAREEEKRAKDEFEGMQEIYSRANSQLIKSKESEEKLRSELDKCTMDLEVIRERYDKVQNDIKRYQLEKSNFNGEFEQAKMQMNRLRLDLERSAQEKEKLAMEIERSSQEKEKLLIELQRSQNELTKEMERVRIERVEKEATMNEVNRLRSELQQKQYGSKNEAMQLKELTEQHMLEVEALQRELDSANNRLEKFRQAESRQKGEIERVMIEFEVKNINKFNKFSIIHEDSSG